VLGANDGIISTASLVLGVASAAAAQGDVLLAGVAGLVAGAMSMAAGEYVSVSSQSDTEDADLARERRELAGDPESEKKELTEIYVSRGVEEGLAGQVAEQLMAKDALGAHARDELGISEITTARPVQAALASAATFSVGAAAPLVLSYVKNPDVLATDRTASVSVLSESTADHVRAKVGTDRPLPVLAWQAMRTLEGFVSLGDASGQYGSQQPVLSWPLAVLALFGLAATVRLARQPRNAFLLAWAVLGLLLGSVLIIDPPSQTRQVVTFPVPYILAALGLDAVLRPVFRAFRTPVLARGLAAIALLIHAAVFNLGGYRDFVESVDLMPRGWDVVRVLQELEPGSTVYVFAGPTLLADSPSLRFAAREQRMISGFTAFDVPERLATDTTFVLGPDYSSIGVTLADRFPGIEREVQRRKGRRQFVLYRCTLANGCRGSVP
jgi:VIT1/CCC1 family predicted Fe2+/Mn2+ transporter